MIFMIEQQSAKTGFEVEPNLAAAHSPSFVLTPTNPEQLCVYRLVCFFPYAIDNVASK
jgi:hypothetical protein